MDIRADNSGGKFDLKLVLGGGSHHDVVVVGPEAGTSSIEIARLMVSASPLRYQVRTRVTGADAVTFRFYGQQIN